METIINGGTWLVLTLIGFFLSFLPYAVHLPVELASGLSTIFGYLYIFDFLVPVNTIMLFLALSIAFQLALASFRFVYMIIRVAADILN